jgi:hypothetical protein
MKGEDMNSGFIVLHRKIMKWEWYSDTNTFRVFLHLLLLANHKPSRFKGHVVDRGQIIIGRKALAKSLNLSEQAVRTALDHLKSTGELTIKATNRFSVATLTKYTFYQDRSPRPTSKTTNNQPTINQQSTTSKQCNNVNNINNITKLPNPVSYSDEYESFWKAYPRKIGKSQAYKAYRARIREGADHADILKAVANYAATVAGKDLAYVKHPSTFLNPDWRDWLTLASALTSPDYESQLQKLYPGSN